MQDRNILITGGTDGMGKATAHQLADMGARLLLVGRNRDKGEAAVTEIIRASGSETVFFLQADLSLVREMRRAAEHIRATFDRLDVLLHSAGAVFPQKRTLTDEGLEMSFAVGHLARLVLTNELLDLLRAAPVPQVLSIAGAGAGFGRVDFDNLNGEKSYSRFRAVTKFAGTNDLLTLEQIARYPDITFYNYGPGPVRTTLLVGTLPMRLFFNTLGRPFSRSPEQAAVDIAKLLTNVYPGGFYGRSLKRNEPSAATSDAAARARLWDYSQTLAPNSIYKEML
jgi:NAD(P)-dependent dehydrogenase (short-subunit alcohol dehydrogenase family)